MNRAPFLERSATVFLQVVIVLIGIGTVALLLWEPHLEGRNAHATLFEIYFKDPFLAYVYLASIAFFIALSRAFTLLGSIGRDQAFSPDALGNVRTIKHCAMALVAMIVAAVAYLFLFNRGKDDIAGGVAIGLAMSFIFVVIATAAGVFERLLQNAVDIKAEKGLTG